MAPSQGELRPWWRRKPAQAIHIFDFEGDHIGAAPLAVRTMVRSV
jgi:hypothetical protein